MDIKVLQMNIRANMLRVGELLQIPDIMEKEKEVKTSWSSEHTYYSYNTDNVELRQRIKMLRKELNQLNKIIEGEI